MSGSSDKPSKGGLKLFKSVKRSGGSKSSWRSSAKKAPAVTTDAAAQQSFSLKPSGTRQFSGDEEERTYSSVGSNGESVSYKSEGNSQSFSASSANRSNSNPNVNVNAIGGTEWKLYKETDGVLKYKPQANGAAALGEDSEDSEIEEIDPMDKASTASLSSSQKGRTETLHSLVKEEAGTKAELTRAQSEVSKMESLNAALTKEVGELKEKLSSANAAHSAEKRELQESLDESLGKMEVLRGERDGLKVKLKALKDTVSGLRTQVDTLIASNAGGKVHSANEGEMLRKEITDLKNMQAGLKEKNLELSNQVASLSKVSSFWESRATVLEDAKKRLEGEIASLQKERDVTYKEKLQQAEQKVSDLQQEYKRDLQSVKQDSAEDIKRREMQKEIERKVGDIKQVNKRFEQIKRENDNLRARITHLETTTCSLSDLNAARVDNATLTQTITSLRESVAKLTQENAELTARIATLNRKKIPVQSSQQADNSPPTASTSSPRKRKGSLSKKGDEESVPESSLLELRLLQAQKENEKLRKELRETSSLQTKYLTDLADMRDRVEGFTRVEAQMKRDFERAKEQFQQDKEEEIREIIANQKVVMEKLMEAVIYEEELKRKGGSFSNGQPEKEDNTKAKSKSKSRWRTKSKAKAADDDVSNEISK